MLGLLLFTVSVVTVRVPLADVGVIIGAIGILFQNEAFRFPKPLVLCGIFVAWTFVCAILSDFSYIVYQTAFETLKLWIIFVVIVNTLRTEKQLRIFLLMYLASFVLSPGRGSLQGYAGGNTVFGRAMWNYNYNNPNDMAALTLLARGFALAVATAAKEKTAIRNLAWLSILMFVIIVFLTQSRGALLGAIAGFGLGLTGLIRRRRGALIIALVATGLAIYFVPQTAWERFAGMSNLTSTATIAEADPEGSAINRWEIKKAAFQMFLARPVFGTGPGAFERAMAVDFPELGSKDTHDTYLNLAAELGLPGFVIWCAMVLTVLISARTSRLTSTAPSQLIEQVWIERAMLAFLVTGFFGTYSRVSYLYLYVGFIWCLSLFNQPEETASPFREKRATSVRSTEKTKR